MIMMRREEFRSREKKLARGEHSIFFELFFLRQSVFCSGLRRASANISYVIIITLRGFSL